MRPARRPQVIIDPGHGGAAAYGGSSPIGVEPERGLAEKNINLELARRVVARLGNGAALTRDRDVNVPLSERSRMAARFGARALVSIHANSGDAGAHGSEVWLHDRHDRSSIDLGQAIYRELGRVGPTRGMYQGPLAVLDPRELGGVAACLIETDYLSHPSGRRRLTNGSDLDTLADAISIGVRSYLARTGSAYGRAHGYRGDDGMSYDYTVPGTIPDIRQPSQMSCWATATTMLMSWRDHQNWDIEGAMDSIGRRWGDLFRRSKSHPGQGGLAYGDEPAFAAAAGLEIEPPTNFGGIEWMDMMQRYGPLAVTADVDSSSSWAIHIRVLYHIHGDGSADGTWVRLMDPASGPAEMTLGQLMAQFEAEAAEGSWDPRVQVFHWPESVARQVIATGQGYGNQSFDYTVPGVIPPIEQPTGMSCWATTTTMMMSWRDGGIELDIEEAMDAIDGEWGDLFRLSRQGGGQGGLAGRDKPRFLDAAGLEARSPTNFGGIGWMDLMQRFGPLWVTADVDPSAGWAIHARIMYHIHGDGSAEGTTVGLIDPADGQIHQLSLREFMRQYEAEAADPSTASLRVQIVHWPESVARDVMASSQAYGRRGPAAPRRTYGRSLHHGRRRSQSYGDNYFTDADELTQSLRDQRAGDDQRVSAVGDAQALVDAYLARGASTVWTGVDSQMAAAEIRARCADHRLFRQGNLNLCGPASFLMMWAGRDPVAYARYALGLLETGRGSIGSRTITASEALRRLTYPRLGSPRGYSRGYGNPSATMTTPAADFVAMASLRNDANEIVPYDGSRSGEQLAGLTTPEEFAGWLRDTGIYSTVREEANWASTRGWDHATGLMLARGVDIALLVNVNALASAARVETISGSQTANPMAPDHAFILNQFPNHFIVMLAEIIPDYGDDARSLSLSVWTWGGSYVFEGVPSRTFMENYYGAVTAYVRR